MGPCPAKVLFLLVSFTIEPQFICPSLPLSVPFLFTLCSHHIESLFLNQPNAFCTCSSLHCSPSPTSAFAGSHSAFQVSSEAISLVEASLVPQVALAASSSVNLKHLVQAILAGATLCTVILFRYLLSTKILQLCTTTSYSMSGSSQVVRAC